MASKVCIVALIIRQAWSRTSSTETPWTQPPVLEFYGGDVFRELSAADLPRRVCAVDNFKPPWWGWPFALVRLRIGLDAGSSPKRGPRFRRLARPRGFCTWFDPDFALCRECPSCLHEASVVFGTRDFAALLPPRGGCLVLEEVPAGVHGMRVGWDHYWDPSVALRLALGLCGAWGWRSLRGSRLLHALMGSIGFLVVIAAGVAWFVISSMQGFVHNQSGAVPLGRLVTTLVTCLVAFVPAARDVLIGWALPTSPLDWYTWINLRDPFFDLPIGWIAAVAAVVGGGFTLWLGAHLSMQYFASAPDPEGDMDFKIGPHGERVDALPPTPRPQRLLGWVIWAAGLALILFSTHSDAFSVVLAVVAVGKDNVLHCVATWRMAMQAGRPEELRPLISTDEYERLGRFHTDNALQALQRHIRMNPRTVHRVREDSELRLRRFSEGGPHCHRPCELDWGDKRGVCALL